MEKGLISVIMGNYNTNPDLLREAIDSVLAQTYTNFEFIIVDDCSTDDSPQVLREYTDPRIKVLYNDQNHGLAYCLNRGLEMCRGEYVARMDTDDLCFPERFEKQVAFMEAHPDVILSGTYVQLHTDNSDTPDVVWRMDPIEDSEVHRIRLLFSNYPLIVHPTWMLNRKLLEEHHLRYKEKYRYSQDYAMIVSCSTCGRCAIVPEVLLTRRRHADMVTKMHTEAQNDFAIQIIQEQLDALHLILPEDVKSLHFRFMAMRKPMSFKMLKWLFVIFKANRKYRVYNQRKLVIITLLRWLRTVGYSLFRLA